MLKRKRQVMQPTLASFWKAQRVEASSVETVIVSEIVSNSNDGDTDVVDKGADVVYKGITITSDDSDERCSLNCAATTDESSSELDSSRNSDIMDSHNTGVELSTDSQPVINQDKAVVSTCN